MAVKKIEYANKVRGDLFTTSNANEVKEAVNLNADELETMSNSVVSLRQSVTSLSQSMSQLKEDSKSLKLEMEEPDATISPGKLYVWGTVSRLSLMIKPGSAGLENEYKLRFTVEEDFYLEANVEIRWVEEPEWETGWTYEVSIEDGLAVYAGWEAQEL